MAKETETTGGGEKPARMRMIFDTDDEIRRAVVRRARKQSLAEDREVSNSEVITEILRVALSLELAEIEKIDRKSKGSK